MNVGGILAHRLGEQGIDELNNRRIVLGFEQIGDVGQRFSEQREVRCAIDIAGDIEREILGVIGSVACISTRQMYFEISIR